MIREHHFDHDGRTLSVGVTAENNEPRLRIYEDGKPITDVVGRLPIETEFDAKMSGFPLDVLDGMIAPVEEAVRSGEIKLPARKPN